MSNEIMANSIEKDDEIDIRELILVLIKNWWIILISTVLIAVGVAIYANKLPDLYTTRTVAAAAGGGGGGGGMAGLAAMMGVNMGGGGGGEVNLMNFLDLIVENTPFLESIIEQEWVIRRLQTKEEIAERAPFVYDTMTLAQFWGFGEPDTTRPDWEQRYKMSQIGMLRCGKQRFISVNRDRQTGTIEITTRFKNPSLSYAVHQFLIDYLREYIEEDRNNRGRERRRFIEERVAEVRGNLNRAEARLADFRERNLMAQSPSVILEGERLAREVALQTSVFTELARQLEIARIDERRDAVSFEIIRQADFPLGPSEPNRRMLYLIGIFGGFFAGIFCVFAKEWILSLIDASKNKNA